MILISPYLNILLNKLSKKDYSKMLIIFAFLWIIIPSFIPTLNYGYSSLFWFVYLYSIAGYIHLYQSNTKGSWMKYLSLGIAFYLANYCLQLMLSIFGNNISIISTIIQKMYEMNFILIFLASLLFSRQQLPVNHFIIRQLIKLQDVRLEYILSMI